MIGEMMSYKFNEGHAIQELKGYIDGTYNEHYASDKYQATDIIIDSGHGEGFCIGNIMKYAKRYGNKDGKNKKDLLKILHYGIIMLRHTRHRKQKMIEDKVGIKEYLGIKINYSNEKLLDKFSLDTLKDRYLWEKKNEGGEIEVKETHAQEAFARASVFGATYKGHTDFEWAQRLYHYSYNCCVHV